MEPKHHLLLVSDSWGRRRLRRVYRQLSQSGSVRVVAFGVAASRDLKSLGIDSVGAESYADTPAEFDLSRRAVAELNEYPTREVGGQPLGDWLQYEGIPLWPFLSPNLFADVNTQLKTLAILEKVIAVEKPYLLVSLDTKRLPFLWYYLRGLAKEPLIVDRIALAIAEKRGIAWSGIKPSLSTRFRYGITSVLGRAFTAFSGGMWLMVLAAIIRRAIVRLARLCGTTRKADKGCTLIFTHRKYWRTEFNPFLGRMAPTDVAIYPVAKALIDTGENIHCLDGNYGFVGGLRELINKLYYERTVCWSTFDQWYPLGRLRSIRKGVKRGIGLLVHVDDLADLFSFSGYSTGALFLPRIHFLVADYLWKSGVWIEGGRNLVRDVQPRAVALTYETGTLSRAIINASYEEKIPTIGLQHGVFSGATDDYVRTSKTHIKCFVPDLTVLWGERCRRVLIDESAYADDEVAVAGNPRMDFLVGAQSLLDNEVSIHKKYGLDPQRRIVLAAPTETIGRTRHPGKDRFFDGIVAAARANGDVQWVVKLKPGAGSEAYYRKRLRDLGECKLVITEDDLYQLMAVADAVVTPPSSIAIESLLMRKPVIYISFPDIEDFIPHLSADNAVFTVRDMADLGRAVDRVCRDYPNGMLSDDGLEKLSAEENFKPDGMAAKRTAELIVNTRVRAVHPAAQLVEEEE
jgi:hypothetical protein